MARTIAVRLRRQIDRDVTLIGGRTHIGVAHEAVEVEGGGGACMGLHGHHFRHVEDGSADGLGNGIGCLDGRALRQVDCHLQLRLVVEGQELHRDMLGVEQAQRTQREQPDQSQEDPAAGLGGEDGAGGCRIETSEFPTILVVLLGVDGRIACHFQHQPRRNHDRYEEGEDHRRRGIGRDRAHIGAHHAGDEEHRQEGGDDGQGCNDRRIADLGDGLNGAAAARALVAHAPVTGDVFDDDDRVIDENADREDKGKERDAVQRVAHQARGEKGEQDRHGNDDGNDQSFATADRQPDEGDDRDGGEAEVVEKLVRLLVGGFAIVAGHLDMNVLRDQLAFQGFDPLEDGFRHDHGIRAGALGDGERDRGHALDAVAILAQRGHQGFAGVGGKIDHGHVADIDRATIAGRQQQIADLGRRGQGLAGDDVDLAALFPHLRGRHGRVCAANLAGQLLQRDPIEGKLFRLGRNADDLVGLTHHIGQADVRDLGDLVADFAHDAGQVVGADMVTGDLGRGEGQRDDRDVVDAPPDDPRFGDADGNTVDIGADLVVDTEHRRVGRGADKEAGGHHDHVVHGLGVDVLDAVDALDDRFQWF